MEEDKKIEELMNDGNAMAKCNDKELLKKVIEMALEKEKWHVIFCASNQLLMMKIRDMK